MDLIRVLFGGIAASLLGMGLSLVSRNYIQKKYKPSLFMAIAWFSFMLEALFYAIKYLFDVDSDIHVQFNLVENLSLIPGFLGMLGLIDTVSRDALDPRKFFIVVFVLGAVAVLFTTYYNSDLVIVPIIIIANVGLVFGAFWLYFCIRIFRNVPRSLKRPAFLNILGALLVSVMYVVANRYISGLSKYIPSIDRIFQAIGALIHAVIFARYEQLYYVLPFKTQRLITFNTKSGLSFFTHHWHKVETSIGEDMFTSMLQGISKIVDESLKKGSVLEIKMEDGVLLISQDSKYPVASVLVASKTSRVLRDGLAAYNSKFVKMFESILDKGVNDEAFRGATRLVYSCFSFIPGFD